MANVHQHTAGNLPHKAAVNGQRSLVCPVLLLNLFYTLPHSISRLVKNLSRRQKSLLPLPNLHVVLGHSRRGGMVAVQGKRFLKPFVLLILLPAM